MPGDSSAKRSTLHNVVSLENENLTDFVYSWTDPQALVHNEFQDSSPE